MSRFIGEYEATLDSKGRFLLPAGLKKIMPEGTATLVLNRGADNCLNLYLEEDWKKVNSVTVKEFAVPRLIEEYLKQM